MLFQIQVKFLDKYSHFALLLITILVDIISSSQNLTLKTISTLLPVIELFAIANTIINLKTIFFCLLIIKLSVIDYAFANFSQNYFFIDFAPLTNFLFILSINIFILDLDTIDNTLNNFN